MADIKKTIKEMREGKIYHPPPLILSPAQVDAILKNAHHDHMHITWDEAAALPPPPPPTPTPRCSPNCLCGEGNNRIDEYMDGE